ncbi:hypothetical protein D3C79_890500 [compost metagenome]
MRFALQLRAVPGFGADQAVLAVVVEALTGPAVAALFTQVAPSVVAETQVTPGFQAVAGWRLEVPGAGAAQVAGRVVVEVFGLELRVLRFTAVQLAYCIVAVMGQATLLVRAALEFAAGAVLVAPVQQGGRVFRRPQQPAALFL